MPNQNERVSIQFLRGKDEQDYPEVRLFRDVDGSKGSATYKFEKPSTVTIENFKSIQKMYLIDEEGEISTRKIDLCIINNCIKEVKSTYCWNSKEEFQRFMRFVKRYTSSNENLN